MEPKTKKKFFRRYRLSRRKSPVKALVLFFILIVVICVLSIDFLFAPPASSLRNGEIHIEISPNETTAEIGEMLQREGVIKSARIFCLYSRIKGLDGSLKAGEYSFAPNLHLHEVIEKMVRGEPVLRTFTIPEGYTVAQIAECLEEEGLASRDGFYSEAGAGDFDYEFLKNLPAGENRLEGYLFPDTYTVRKDSSEREIIDIMLRRFEEKINNLNYSSKAQSVGLNLHEAVTIASMIEREARVDDERSLISGVIFNRLEKGMMLQIDATVQYALGEHKPVVSLGDLEVDSPYNTYKVYGLPPGPIASPGEASLLAAVEPAQTDYLYYCAKPDGSHAFSRTLDEHNANVSKYINN